MVQTLSLLAQQQSMSTYARPNKRVSLNPRHKKGIEITVGAPLLDKGRVLNKISQPKPQEVLSV